MRRLWMIFVFCFLQWTVASFVMAADKPDFSGTYTLTGSKGGFKIKKGDSWTLQVDQTEAAVKVTIVQDGNRTSNQFLLNGAETIYVSPGGVKGTSKSQLKGKSLIVDTLVESHPTPDGPAVQLHTREQWALSSNSKTLTIQSQVDSPTFPLGGFQVIEPWSEIYTRN